MSPKDLVPANGNDRIWTPDALATDVVKHFNIPDSATILEPCSGGGAFLRAFEAVGLKNVQSCEISEGKDFFEFKDKVDWVVTNPPWSKMRAFLKHAYTMSDNVLFLVVITHIIGLKARVREMQAAGFGVKEIAWIPDTPPAPWPQSGFQLAANHLQRGYVGDIKFRALERLN